MLIRTCVLWSHSSSFTCGLAGALASNPVDVVRTRIMNQRGVLLYQGTLACILQVSHHIQIRGNLKGTHFTNDISFFLMGNTF